MVGYYLDVATINVDEEPIAGAALDMTDNLSEKKSYVSDAQGRIDDILVLEYLRNATDTVQLNPYALHAYDFSTGYSITTLDIHSDSSVVLNLTRHGSFGTSIATGDLNNDGIEDIAVGSPSDSQNGENTGAVFVFFGPQGSVKVLRPIDADLVIHGERNGSRLGSTLLIQDINDDEIPELVVGAPEHNRTTGGLMGEYYNNDDYTNLEFTRIDSNIDFPWGNSDPGGLGDAFSVRWTGHLMVEAEDDYTFYAEIDDGMWLYIDGTLVIERRFYDSSEASSGPVHMEPGFHNIAISFRDTGGAARMLLKWESPNMTKEIIPPESFFSNVDTGSPDGGVFVFAGELFEQGETGSVEMEDALLLSSTGEGLGDTLTIANMDMDRYLDILAGSALGVEVFYGQRNIDVDATIQQATLYGLEQPVLVNINAVETLAAVMSDEIRLFPMAPDGYSLDSYVSEEDFDGTFNFTVFNDGLTIYSYQVVGILPNGDFDDEPDWVNWTQTVSIRGDNDGTWELTTEEHGDWHVYDGPTAGLGPDRDNVASGGSNGRDNDGKLVSDPFTVSEGVEYIDFWHHVEWWSFESAGPSQWQDEYADFISIRVVNDSDGSIVAEKKYGRDWGGENGEEEGRLQLDVSDHWGELMRFEMELSNNRHQNDDGIVQIDNITGLQTVPDAKGDFISDLKDLGFSVDSLFPHWDEELNDGNITLYYRTNTSHEWTLMEKDLLVELPGNEETTFQYKVALDAAPGEPYPVLKGLYFNLYNFTPESLGPGIPYDAGSVFGNDTLAIVDDTTAVLYNRTSPGVNITSDHEINALTSIEDVDGNGISDLLISANDIVYLILMNLTAGDVELKDAPYTFSGEEDFGLVLHRNLVGSPFEHRQDGRVYILPTRLNDSAIIGVDIENHSFVYPDSGISLNLSLLNKGLFDMDSLEVTMNITGEGGYSYENSTLISIDSWESAEVKFDWHVPDEEGTNYTLRFSLSPDDHDSNNFFSLDLRAHYHALDISTVKDFDVVRPGGVLDYLIELKNMGTFGSDNMTFEAELPLNWDWWVRKDGKNITHLVVDDNENIELFVRANSSILGEYPIVFSVISENGVTNATLDLAGHIVEADLMPFGVGLFRGDGKEAKLVAGDNTTMVLEIKNVGTQDAGIFDVSLDVDGIPDQVKSAAGVQGNSNVTVSFIRVFTEGIHNLTFVVDIDDAVKEYNETNNIFILQIEVRPETATTPFVFRVKVIDLKGENVTDANVTAKCGESEVENRTDSLGNTNLTLLDSYREGSTWRVEAIKGELYAAAEVRVYSEDGFADLMLVVGRYSLTLKSDERNKDIMPD
ncbi:MAG: FG-GAP repeat protein, partial [Thermoplasmata archaeon]|nr:FG-GAP repeat protein [Thermoplasmata archaeon]